MSVHPPMLTRVAVPPAQAQPHPLAAPVLIHRHCTNPAISLKKKVIPIIEI